MPQAVFLADGRGRSLRFEQLWECLSLAGWSLRSAPPASLDAAGLPIGTVVLAWPPWTSAMGNILERLASRHVPVVVVGEELLDRPPGALPNISGVTYLVSSPDQLGSWDAPGPLAAIPPGLTGELERLALSAVLRRVGRREREGSPCLAWIGGPEAVAGLVALADGWGALRQALGQAELHLFGVASPPPELAGRSTIAVPSCGPDWRAFLERLASSDLLLVPPLPGGGSVAPPDDWAILLAAAVAVPSLVIASAGAALAGPQGRDRREPPEPLVEDGVSGALVTHEEWARAAEALLGDREACRRLGWAARSRAIGSHATAAQRWMVARAFEALVSGPGPRARPVTRWTIHAAGAASAEADLCQAAATELAQESAAGQQPLDRDSAPPGVATATPERLPADGPPSAAARRLAVASDDHALEHPMGPELVAAERALRESELVAAFGPWLARHVADRYRVPTIDVGLPIDGHLFHPRPLHREPVVAYCLPRYRRPLSLDLGVQALQALQHACREAGIVLFGLAEDEVAGEGILLRHEWAGNLTPAARADLLGRTAVLLWTEFTNIQPLVAEAMASGCAVVAVDLPHQRWLLVDGVTARLVPPRPDILCEAIAGLLRDADRRQRLVLNGYDAVAGLTSERSLAELQAVAHWAPAEAAAANGALPRLDLLQELAERRSPWSFGRRPALVVTFASRHDGLSGIDVGCELPPDAAVDRLRLSIGDGLDSGGHVRPLVVARAGSWDGRWLSFRFPPLETAGGRRLWVQLLGDGADSTGVRPWVAAAERMPEARLLVDGQETAYAPTFRTWVTACPALPIALSGATARMLNCLLTLEQEVDLVRREYERDRRSLPYRLRHPLADVPRRLPPAAERPWSADAPVTVKARHALREYGLLALLAEAADWLRWQRMTAAERQRAAEEQPDSQGGPS